MSKQFKNIAEHLKYSQYDTNTHISNKNPFLKTSSKSLVLGPGARINLLVIKSHTTDTF